MDHCLCTCTEREIDVQYCCIVLSRHEANLLCRVFQAADERECSDISTHAVCCVVGCLCHIAVLWEGGYAVTPMCAVVVTTCFFVVIKVIQFKRKMVRTLNSCLRPERVRSSSV